jgi:hypothetical protein
VEQAQELVEIMRAKQNLTTLCGLSGKETELDFSGQDLEAGDAVAVRFPCPLSFLLLPLRASAINSHQTGTRVSILLLFSRSLIPSLVT